ncbi:hypothetical protein VZ95_03285 [Elstera litoralis]|uniref:Methyltransferase type 11 domain-containing protein n=1 Tax=Elstera litoralis TaxID=552518 RepID=A0A0F3IVW3_9PROT|nr:class I SAM-dependent methyltransferase [Elstera litoralis]KJV10678.1 hypothetical protein VZ95_03285 [Elstera litoralis]
MSGFKDHFSSVAQGYAAFRPRYRPQLAEDLAALCPQHRLAWDAGCGSGQFSALLPAQFEQVVATDASAEQIAAAPPHPQIEYRAARAEASGLPDGSVDLITVAQAAHWFDLPAFYAECARVAAPGCVLALITYAHMRLPEALTALFWHFYDGVLGPFWPPDRRHVEQGYATLPFPFAPLPLPPQALEAVWGLDQVLGYVETWSAVRGLLKAEGDARLRAFKAAFHKTWLDTQGEGAQLALDWPVTVRVGRIRPL